MPAAPATEAEIKRVIKAWTALGLQVGGVEVTKQGTVRVLAPLDKPPAPALSSRQPESWD